MVLFYQMSILNSQSGVGLLTTIGLLHIIVHVSLRVHTKLIGILCDLLTVGSLMLLILRFFARVVISLLEVIGGSHVSSISVACLLLSVCGKRICLSQLLGCDSL